MARIVSPERDQLDKLRQPMTQGEKRVFEFFDFFMAGKKKIWTNTALPGGGGEGWGGWGAGLRSKKY